MRRAVMTSLAFGAVLALAACGGTSTTKDEGPTPDVPGDVLDVPPADGVDVPGDEGRDSVDDVAGDDGKDVPGDTPKPDVADDVKPTDTPTDTPPTDTVVPCTEGDPCDDGNPCTHGETCGANGTCAGGTAYTCDDHRPCTDDTCDGKGNCRYTVKDDACLIDGVCRATGDVSGDNPCLGCDPGTDEGGWSPAADQSACDPTATLARCEAAPLGGKCVAGACVPDLVQPLECSDGNPCTTKACDPLVGCVFTNVSGMACALEDKCKLGTCMEGHCIIQPDASCDDGNPCSKDTCDPANGCLHELLSEISCDDRSECTVDDTCFGGTCSGITRNCDDGNICTLDGCDGITGCWHDITDNTCCEGGVSKCDDANPCTNDNCDPDTLACINTPNTAACNDGNSCTVNDSCDDGYCTGVSKNCNDGNSCTLDACQDGKCLHTAQEGVACDDGLDCTTGDRCVAGACLPTLDDCKCKPEFAPAISKFVTMSIADNGQSGSGLNLDENAGTCAPAENCCCGVDNALGPVAGLPVAQDGIKQAMDEGKIILMFEHRGLRTDGGAYTLAFYAGKLDPSNPNCDFKTQSCLYIVDKAIFDVDCKPLVTLDNAKIVGNKLTAGGKQYRFPFDLPLMEGINLHVDLYFTRVEGTVTVAGNKVIGMTGILGGAVPKQQIIDAIQAIPDAEWPPSIPVDKGTILSLIDLLVVPDIDGDGDGELESASLGIKFSAIGGTITGVY